MSPTNRLACVLVVLAIALVQTASGQERPRDPAAAKDARGDVPRPLPSSEEIGKLPPDGGPEFNRLIHETSPYLLAHARNPVDWYPWGDEAFERARREDKPVFLSIGYSTCHWCHVMERESFEDEAIAAILNQYFIAIKVDREERPDIDEIYMLATQLLTEQGGWPNSIFLTVDRKPWFAGTYYPPEDRDGRPGFKTVLLHLRDMWKDRRQDVEQVASQLSEAVTSLAARSGFEPTGKLDGSLVNDALGELKKDYDAEHGGFGSRPKFPPHADLRLMLHELSRRPDDESLKTMVMHTLEAIALGGIHDHIGGGFHRYSTDAQWIVPHFEKMLYDNAQLARSFAEAYVQTRDPLFRNAAIDILEWVRDAMRSPEGGFYSALDADSGGEEGAYYLWRPEEVADVLGPEDASLFCKIYGITEAGNDVVEPTGERTGASVPYLQARLEATAKAMGIDAGGLSAQLETLRKQLLARRNDRVRPRLDDKILAGWNGLMIGALAYAGKQLGEPQYVLMAIGTTEFVLHRMGEDGRLHRSYRDGLAHGEGYLEDYAYLADAMIELFDATSDREWLERARSLADYAIVHFRSKGGGFFNTSDEHEALFARSKDPIDQVMPSPNGVLARVLLRLSKEGLGDRYRQTAEGIFQDFLGLMQHAPSAMPTLLLAVAQDLDTKTAPAEPDEPDATASEKPITVRAYLSRSAARPGGDTELALEVDIAEGWHINADAPHQSYLVPTRVHLADGAPAELKEVRYPPPEALSLALDPEPMAVYQGTIWIRARLVAKSEGELLIPLVFSFQSCNDSTCLPPADITLSLPITVTPDAKENERRHPAIFGK